MNPADSTDPRDQWELEHTARCTEVLARLEALYQDTRTWARAVTKERHANPIPDNWAAERKAWALVEARSGPGLDALGATIDPTLTPRERVDHWDHAFLLATGHPFVYPDDDDDMNKDHRAGLHTEPLRRGFTGDLEGCDACQDYVIRTLNRKAP